MKFKAKTFDDKEIIGNYVVYEGLSLMLVQSTETGITQTRIRPETLEEVDD